MSTAFRVLGVVSVEVVAGGKCGRVPLDTLSHLWYYCDAMTNQVIRDTSFEMVANGVKPDSKKRIVLPKCAMWEGVTYHIYRNSLGQIVLDPQLSIPAYEAWLFRNPEALASVKQGLLESAQGLTKSRGSFAKYGEDAS